jgi:hypothetical protein
MTIHAPLELWFAVGAAVAVVFGLVALVASGAGSGDARGRVIAGLSAWLAVDVALAAVGVFAASVNRPVPIIAVGIVLPVVIGVWLLGRRRGLSRFVDSIPLHSLIDVQLYRVVGAVFILAWALGRMPAIFALTAGLGDLAVGLAAPFVAARLEGGTERSRQTAVLWNVAGITDLVVAVALGAATSPTPIWPVLLGHPNPLISRLPFVLIPIFAVPLSILLHIVSLRRLSEVARDRQRTSAGALADLPPARGRRAREAREAAFADRA